MEAGDLDQRQHARQLALALRSQMVLSPEDEEVLWWLLQRHTAPAAAAGASGGYEGGGAASSSGELCLNYDDFTQVAAEAREAIGPSADAYLQASTFLRLPRDAGGCVPAAALFRYCVARSAQIQLRVQLGVLDAAGAGTLTPAVLRGWLEGRAPLAACSEALVSDDDWCTAVLARLLLLHARRGRLPLRELVGSPEGLELALALHAWDAAEAAAPAAEDGGGGGEPPGATLAAAAAAQPAAWLAPARVAALRLRFAELDGDRDGLLSPQDFSSFTQGTMTPLFIRRLFAQHCTSASGPGGSAGGSSSGGSSGSGGGGGGGGAGGRMDFAAFCAFCAAWEQRHRPAATRYFFQVLDARGCGYLTQADLYTFFREVHALWLELGQYSELRVEDVLSEVTDLLAPADPAAITPADFARSGAAATVIGLLADVNLFWEYENREALLQQQQQLAGGGGEGAAD